MNGRSDYTKEGGLDKFFILDKRYLFLLSSFYRNFRNFASEQQK